MKVYERLAQDFAGEGVSAVFGLMGSGTLHWVAALEKIGVRQLEVRHEGVGLGMADGWARVTRTPGVCSATCGPGVTQLATALVTASRAGSPVVAFVGETEGEDAQSLDQQRFAAACEAGFVRVSSPEAADDAVRKAFYLAKLESRPILLSAPLEVQKASCDYDEPYQPSSTLLSSRAVQPDLERLAEAADIIAASRKPVIICGQGAIWSGAGKAITKLGQRIGALTVTTLMAKGFLSETEYHAGISGNYSTRTAIQLFEECDCVIAVGATLNRYTTMQGYLYPNARIVHVDIKPHVMISGGRSADCYLQSDARAGVEALERLLAQRSVKLTGYRTSEVKERLAHHFEDPAKFEIEPGCVDPRDACRVLDEIIPADVGLVMGSATNAGFTTMLFNRPRPYAMGGHFFGCIGQSLPAAMGAAVGTGMKPTLLVDGDAAFMMHIGEFDTAVRYQIPLLAVILNDQALGSEYHKMNAEGMKAELSIIPTPDLGAVGKVFGGRGRLARSIDEVRAAAAEWVAKPGPMIIDVRTSRNVVTLQKRRLLYARDE